MAANVITPPEDAATYLRKLANDNVCEGVDYEPRIWANRFEFTAITASDRANRRVDADESVYYNGEETPVRITHLAAIMDPTGTEPSPALNPSIGDERMIQRFGVRIKAHDTYYMNHRHIPLPLLHNKRTALAEIVAQGNSVWKFDHPVTMGQRDAFVVDVQLFSTPASARIVGVSFDGYGAISKRPYRLHAAIELTDTTSTQLDTSLLKNDGAEVIRITQMVVTCNSPIDATNPAGDIQQLRIGVRQTGNGSQHDWDKTGPIGAGGAQPLLPAGLWAPTGGRAVVHELPDKGWLFHNGQGVNVDMLHLDTTRQQNTSYVERVWFALLGYRILV